MHKEFLDVAAILATKSHCVSHQVAAIAVLDGRIVATGINGTLKGQPNCNEVYPGGKADPGFDKHHEWAKIHEVHAEQNLIALAARHGLRLGGATVYTTLAPCADCAKLLAASGIVQIVYHKPYDKGSPESLELCRRYGMTVTEYKEGTQNE